MIEAVAIYLIFHAQIVYRVQIVCREQIFFHARNVFREQIACHEQISYHARISCWQIYFLNKHLNHLIYLVGKIKIYYSSSSFSMLSSYPNLQSINFSKFYTIIKVLNKN